MYFRCTAEILFGIVCKISELDEDQEEEASAVPIPGSSLTAVDIVVFVLSRLLIRIRVLFSFFRLRSARMGYFKYFNFLSISTEILNIGFS